jgi:hypothetical protein
MKFVAAIVVLSKWRTASQYGSSGDSGERFLGRMGKEQIKTHPPKASGSSLEN